ncbi:MAG TPA: hypothetical protein VGE52_03480, partial [Pirellulales bacterium]
ALRLIGQAKLRSPAQLEAFRIHALMMHWRLRDFALHPQAMNFTEFSKRSWIGEFDLAGFEIVNDDVALQGVPIAEADAELVDVCRSIARERHLAINWLLGESEIYSETDTST